MDGPTAAARAFARMRATMLLTDLRPPEKVVLLVLSIMANEDGEAWPAITTLAAYASLGRRTTFDALDGLEARELIDRIVTPGKGTTYRMRVEGCASRTSAGAAPVREPHSTGAGAAPKQPRTTNKRKKASPSPSTRNAFPMPDGVDATHWRDFLANRARKRLPNTASAHARLMNDLDRLADHDWTIPRLIQHAAERGWAGIYDPKGSDHDNRNRNSARSGRSAVVDAYAAAYHHVRSDDEPI
ncbi:hypothetical protein ACVOMT_16625 [Sphingomonas panni]